jgi:hypothetical protein
VIYFWQGSRSSTLWAHCKDSLLDVQARAQEAAIRKNIGGKVPVVRLAEGDEPPHFLGLFGGAMAVQCGAAGDYDAVRFLRMFQVERRFFFFFFF